MTKSDDKHNDRDLKAYLDGSDGVSAAYRKAARDEPPAALDRAILDAAREEVVAKEPAIGGREIPHMYGTAALAASVMVGILATSLYFNPQEIAVPVSAPAAGQRVVLDEVRSAATEREEAENLAAFSQASVELRIPDPPAAIADNAAAPSPRAEIRAEAVARLAQPPVVVFDGPLLDAIEADAAQAQATAQAQTAPRTLASTGARSAAQTAGADAGELEEITVTGSRIPRRDTRDYSYRESREDWLEEIRAQVEALDALSRLTGNTVYQEQLLQEEMDLYAEVYPDADLDVELAE